jgi:hypothetical protein
MTSFSSNVKTANFDTPKYLNGSTVSSTEYFPYYQGTSTIANGWLATSTSQYNPARASQWTDVNGVANWWCMDYKLFNQTVSSSEVFKFTYYAQMVSDINASVQIVNMITFTGFSDVAFDGQDVSTYELLANKPVYVSLTYYASGASSVDGAGMMMRNMTSGANVVVTEGRLVSFRQKQ